jgi:hypothetical protein
MSPDAVRALIGELAAKGAQPVARLFRPFSARFSTGDYQRQPAAKAIVSAGAGFDRLERIAAGICAATPVCSSRPEHE